MVFSCVKITIGNVKTFELKNSFLSNKITHNGRKISISKKTKLPTLIYFDFLILLHFAI